MSCYFTRQQKNNNQRPSSKSLQPTNNQVFGISQISCRQLIMTRTALTAMHNLMDRIPVVVTDLEIVQVVKKITIPDQLLATANLLFVPSKDYFDKHVFAIQQSSYSRSWYRSHLNTNRSDKLANIKYYRSRSRLNESIQSHTIKTLIVLHQNQKKSYQFISIWPYTKIWAIKHY